MDDDENQSKVPCIYCSSSFPVDDIVKHLQDCPRKGSSAPRNQNRRSSASNSSSTPTSSSTSGSSFVSMVSSTPNNVSVQGERGSNRMSLQRTGLQIRNASRHVEPMPLVTPSLRRSNRILVRQLRAVPPDVERLRLTQKASGNFEFYLLFFFFSLFHLQFFSSFSSFF